MNSESLRRRIKSIKSTAQITKAMETVAASKYGRVLAMGESFGAYMRSLEAVMRGTVEMPGGRETAKSVCYVLFTGNRGMCGQYNADVINLLEELLREETRPYTVVACGRKGEEALARSTVPFESFELPDVPEERRAELLEEKLYALRTAGLADEIFLVYGKYKNVLVHTPVSESLLPQSGESGNGPAGEEYIFLPDREALTERMKKQYVKARIYSVMLSAAEGFHSAVLTAMRSACDSSDEMLERLEKELSRKRQGEITTEVLELAAGADRRET
ncbi:MAG: F0F1 ATP synthase subunit gamma [Oscillospiraceae bacterium]|nr:F0F1 ATP synthase subunit gamma [Oscillospiraceae bacterium]